MAKWSWDEWRPGVQCMAPLQFPDLDMVSDLDLFVMTGEKPWCRVCWVETVGFGGGGEQGGCGSVCVPMCTFTHASVPTRTFGCRGRDVASYGLALCPLALWLGQGWIVAMLLELDSCVDFVSVDWHLQAPELCEGRSRRISEDTKPPQWAVLARHNVLARQGGRLQCP